MLNYSSFGHLVLHVYLLKCSTGQYQHIRRHTRTEYHIAYPQQFTFTSSAEAKQIRNKFPNTCKFVPQTNLNVITKESANFPNTLTLSISICRCLPKVTKAFFVFIFSPQLFPRISFIASPFRGKRRSLARQFSAARRSHQFTHQIMLNPPPFGMLPSSHNFSPLPIFFLFFVFSNAVCYRDEG